MKLMNSFFKYTTLAVSIAVIPSCSIGNKDGKVAEGIPSSLTASTVDNSPAGQLYTKALALESQGKGAQAQKLYKSIAKKHASSSKAPEAIFRTAKYNESQGKYKKAFDNYQFIIDNYLSSPLYKQSIDSQIIIAQNAAQGISKDSKLFIKTNFAPQISDEMLAAVLQNAPHAKSAPQTAFIRGQLWDKRNNEEAAILHYRTVTRNYADSNYSAEALFRIGEILYNQSLNGNTNLDNAKYAIETFNELSTLYPRHPKAAEGKALIGKINGYAIQRSYEVAQFYENKKQYVSAVFYYNDVIKSAPKTSELYKLSSSRIEALTSTPATNL